MVNTPNGVLGHLGGVLNIPLNEWLEEAREADESSRVLLAKLDYLKEYLKEVLSEEKQIARIESVKQRLSNDEAEEIARSTPAYKEALKKRFEIEKKYAAENAKSRDLQRRLDWARSGISYLKSELALTYHTK